MQERQVVVTDKNGNRIAVFSNLTSLHSETSQKNVMVAPTVDIVSNGESTLTFQMLAESEKWQQIKNPENLYYCNNRVYTALNEQSITYDGLVVTVQLVELWYLLKYKYVQAHNVDTKIEAMDEHTVKILPKTKTSLKLTVNGKTYEDSQVKDSRGVVMPRGSAGYALWALLRDSGWTLGVCDVLPDGFSAANDYGTFNVESDMKSVLENIQFVQSMYGGILDWDSQNKVLNLRDEEKEGTDFNTWNGFVARKGKNFAAFPTITWDNNLVTRLYPLGNGNLNIKRVNNDKGYVDNFSYTTAIYEGYLQNANIYDTNDEGGQKTLKFWGEQQLKKLCRPRKSIEYQIVDKRGTAEGWTEPFDINDIIKAYYIDEVNGAEVWEYQRIQHITYNWFWPGSDTTLEVGDKVSNATELFYQIYKDVNNSAKTDASGHISGDDIWLEYPEDYWEELGGYGYGSLQYITRLHAEHETANTKAVADLQVYADDTFATIESFTYFKEETDEKFSESWTAITQTSNALEAQIKLEAVHYSEVKTGLNNANTRITETNATLTATANDLSAQIKAEASLRSTEIDNVTKKINSVSTSLATFEATVEKNYATTAMLSSYATKNYVTGAISTSEASIKSYADKNYASVNIEAKVNNLGSHFTVDNYSIYMSSGSGGGGYVGLSSSSTTIGRSGTNTTIYGSRITVSPDSYIQLPTSNTRLGTRTLSTQSIKDGDGNTVRVVTAD